MAVFGRLGRHAGVGASWDGGRRPVLDRATCGAIVRVKGGDGGRPGGRGLLRDGGPVCAATGTAEVRPALQGGGRCGRGGSSLASRRGVDWFIVGALSAFLPQSLDGFGRRSGGTSRHRATVFGTPIPAFPRPFCALIVLSISRPSAPIWAKAAQIGPEQPARCPGGAAKRKAERGRVEPVTALGLSTSRANAAVQQDRPESDPEARPCSGAGRGPVFRPCGATVVLHPRIEIRKGQNASIPA